MVSTGKKKLTTPHKSKTACPAIPRRTPTNPYLNPKESDVMKQLKIYLDYRFGVKGWVHVANETIFLSWLKGWHPSLVPILLRFLKSIGVKPGFPDIIIFERALVNRVRLLGGMAIEVKREKGGKVSPGQREWLEHFDSIGWATAIGYGYQDTINKIEEVYGKV